MKKVAVLGAGGGIGQPLSFLLKIGGNPGRLAGQPSSLVSHLNLYDIRGMAGFGADMSHMCNATQVTPYEKDDLKKALTGVDVVLIPAGVPRKPGMTRDDLFNTNAGIVADLAQACAENCPKAMVLIISNPVNSTVPIAAEVFKKQGVYDPSRIMGVTHLDAVRAKTFVGEQLGKNPEDIVVPVIGGHSGPSIVPLISQTVEKTTSTSISTSGIDMDAITHRIQYGGDEVVKAKAGEGSATWSMAWAAADFTWSMLETMNGNGSMGHMSAFMDAAGTDLPNAYFATPLAGFTADGGKLGPMPSMSQFEEGILEKCIPELSANIEKGVAFAKTR